VIFVVDDNDFKKSEIDRSLETVVCHKSIELQRPVNVAEKLILADAFAVLAGG